jgi:glycosyltransferase involved in cell wall biosynthesis
MAAREEQTGAEQDAAAKQFARTFDTARAAAITQFRQLLPQKAQAGKLLQQLNKLDRHDVALAVTDDMQLDAAIGELVITERARALVATGAAPLAERLLAQTSAPRRNDYAFNYNAGRVLSEARLFAEALPYYEAAFRAKPTALAAERIFIVHLMLQQYEKAAIAMGRVIRTGSYRDALSHDFAFLLRHIEPGTLDPELAFALAALPGKQEERVLAALVPHLIANDMLDSVLALDFSKFQAWDDAALLNLVLYLERRKQIDHLLRLYEQSGTFPMAARESLRRLLADLPPERFAALLIPNVSEFLTQSRDAQTYRTASERFLHTVDADAGLEMIQLLPALVPNDRAAAFYAREKRPLGRLAAYVAEKLAPRDDVIEALTAFVLHWVSPQCAEFFRSPDAVDLAATIAAAKQIETAPRDSKAGLLREDYFRFHIERRSFLRLETLTNDFELCNVVLNYFSFAADQRPAAIVPVGADLAARLGQTALSFGGGKPLDVLASFVMMQERPGFSLDQSPEYDEFCWWYVTRVCDARKVPPACLRPEIAAYLNNVISHDGFSGIPITRFLRILWLESPEDRKAFDLGNFVDRILLILERLRSSLPRRTQLLPFYEPFLSDRNGIFGRVLAALNVVTPALMDEHEAAPFPAIRVADAPQDIVLIGHASKESGLGRNFGMLKKALSTAGAVITGIDFDSGAETVSAQLVRWREGCRTPPLAVFAVNAHDVPDFYLKDRRGVLLDCYAAGFFLWEMSAAPEIQQLGIALVDEIWAPTSYVADVYASSKPTHVVGKGLFRGDEPFLNAPRKRSNSSAFKFVTVFDFDSSIERKNPLATVMAFQDAFPGKEDVELIVKTSNVNPQHWSNAWQQWERLIGAAAGDDRVKIVTRRYTDEEMTALVRDADCVVSLHRSEGFGYLVSDAMALGTPTVATNYSGNADFATPETSYPVSHKLIPVPAGAARWRLDNAQWADADSADAARQMRAVFDGYEAALAKAAHAQSSLKAKYSVDAFAATLAARLAAIRAARA